MDLGTAAAWAEVFGLITILGAAIYSWFQIKELRRSRDSTTALNLAANFQNRDFVVGLALIANSGFTLEDLEDEDEFHFQTFKNHFGKDWPKVMTVLTTWESLGVLIHRGDMDFHTFYDLFSGVIIKSYHAFSPYLEAIREDKESKDLEWFIWLVDRTMEYEAKGSGTPPAHLAFKDWKPPTRN